VSTFKAQAILLISGPGMQSQLDEVKAKTTIALKPFALSIRENQSICLGGRIIAATLIDCDPAHLSAIEQDLKMALHGSNLDVATELI
jgi:hypothetical protein